MIPKLLLVDDDEATRDALKRTLRQDFNILEAESGLDALTRFSENPDISIVIADEKMPGQTGTDLLAQIKILYPHTVRIILSGHIRLDQMMVAVNNAEIHRFIVKPWDNDILRLQVREALAHHRDLDEMTRLKTLAITDSVTNLTNHRYFQERIREEIERSARHERTFSLIMADVDHFKRYNDLFGHPEGDKALAKIAMALNRSTRVEDSVSRYGGEEFIILLPETSKNAALEVAERIQRDLESFPIGVSQNNPPVLTLSMGISTYPSDGATADELIKSADQALYRAKEKGRNRIETEKS